MAQVRPRPQSPLAQIQACPGLIVYRDSAPSHALPKRQ